MMQPTGVFDLFALLVTGVFGSFWIAVVGITLVMFVIMGFLGRISIYSCLIYSVMFLLCMTLGYGMVTLNIILSLAIITAFFFSLMDYIQAHSR